MFEDEAEVVDKALESALDTIDQATLALHLSHNAVTSTERIRFGRQALHYFVAAQAKLEHIEDNVRATVSWRVWYDETRKGIASAHKLLDKG
jgi:hypothetical protein